MITFLDILSYLATWGYILIFFLILHRFIPLRKNKLVRVLALIVCVPFADIIIYSNDLPNILGALLLFAAYIVIFHQGKWIEKLTAVLVFYPVVIAVNYLMLNIGTRLFFSHVDAPVSPSLGWTPWMWLISTAFHTTSLVARFLFWSLAWLFLRKYLQQITSNLTTRMWLIVDALALAPTVAIFTIIYCMPEEILVVYPICSASIISSFGSIYLAAYICNSVQTAYHAQELEKKQAYIQDQLKEEERVRSIYHDMKNHLLVLQAQSAQSQEVYESARFLREQIETYESYYHTGNDYLDVILRDKAKLAKEKLIDFHAAVNFSDGDFIEPLDISTIFGNALDNAIEASEKLPESMRLITVKASRIHDMMIAVVENNRRLDALDSGKTSKEDQFLHGFGIPNIQKAAEKYGGECIVRQKEDKFVLKVVLPIESQM